MGEGLRVSALAEDGGVEGIEDPAKSFAVGVLWHPEESAGNGGPLFAELIARARE